MAKIHNIEEYQSLVLRTAKPLSVKTAWYNALGLGGEAGELQEQIKKLYRDDGFREDVTDISEERRRSIVKEMGDVLWYLAQLGNKLDISLAEVAGVNIEKLEIRDKKGLIHGEGDDREELCLTCQGDRTVSCLRYPRTCIHGEDQTPIPGCESGAHRRCPDCTEPIDLPVDPTGTMANTYASIREAVGHAQIGDTIVVGPGDQVLPLDLLKGFNIRVDESLPIPKCSVPGCRA